MGTGSTLTLSLAAASNGGSEVFILDNIVVDGTPAGAVIPEPVSPVMAGLGLVGLGLVGLRRRRLA